MNLQIWDSAGHERFRNITESFFRGVHGVILVFDLASIKTLEEINSYWLQYTLEKAGHDTPLVLVGNKCDKKDQIQKEANKKILKEINREYIRTSAVTNENIALAFDKVIDLI